MQHIAPLGYSPFGESGYIQIGQNKFLQRVISQENLLSPRMAQDVECAGQRRKNDTPKCNGDSSAEGQRKRKRCFWMKANQLFLELLTLG